MATADHATADHETSADYHRSETGAPRTVDPRAGRERTVREGAAGVGRAIVFVLFGAALGYVGGRVHGGFEMRDAVVQLDEQRASSAAALEGAQRARDEALGQAEGARAQAEARAIELERTLSLHRGALSVGRALAALDARNFGTAERHVREAEGTLRALTAAQPDLEPIVRSLGETEVLVAGDLAGQRAELGAIRDSIDALLASATTTAASPTTPTSAPEEL
jgi:hypothetical protein